MELSSFLICPRSDTFKGFLFFFFFPSQFCHITASLAPSPPPVQTQTPPAPLGPLSAAYLIHYAVAFVCLACNDGQDDHQMKCAVESV